MESISALSSLVGLPPSVIIAVILWTLVWKGFALWRAGNLRQKWWFLAFLFLNTLGVLEIIYLFWITKGYEVEVVEEK